MPPAVLNLVIINGIMFIAMIYAANTRNIDMNAMLGLYDPRCADFHWYQYATNIFMHANFSHILFNMFGLWLFGSRLEGVWGTKRFLIFYLVCGIGASVVYQVWELFVPHSCVPAIGASGAVFGLLIASAMLFPNMELYIYGLFPMRMKWLAILYGGLEIWNGLRNTPGDNVAHFAHIGGMIFGFILVKIYSRSRTNFY